ncbi:MAG: magnesium transporter CorA family protein [Anaerolineaceae bacterium]
MTESSVRYFYINNAGKISLVSSLHDAIKAAEDSGYFWLDFCDPNSDDLEPLIPKLGLHPLSIEDCLNDEQLPKLDLFPNYSFMIFNIFEPTAEELIAHELDLFIGSNYLISVTGRDSNGSHLLQSIDRSLEREQEYLKLGPAYLLHMIVDKVVDHKFSAIESIEEVLDGYETVIIDQEQDFNPGKLMDSRRDLQTIRKSLFHERELVSKIIRQDSPFFPERSIVYFRDVYDHLSKYYEMSDSARDLVTSLMEIHLSMINNRMSRISNRTNATMRRLTLITTIFMPLTLIAGIGGMSEFTMLTGGEKNANIAYLILIAVMAIIGTLNWLYLRKMERDLKDSPED